MVSAREPQSDQQPRTRRKPPDIRFPQFTLADSLAVAEAIQKKGGGTASRDQLAAFLGYSTTNSGTFLTRLAAARTFNLVTSERGGDFVITPLAQKILMPVYPAQTTEGLVEAFLGVPLFKAIYEEHKGKELPPEFGIKNLLRTKYSIMGRTTDIAYRALMESAEQAQFFATRGSRTHLIMPSVTIQRKPEDTSDGVASDPNLGGGGGDGKPPAPPSHVSAAKEEMRMKYVDKLFGMIDTTEDKAEKKELLDRIEQFLKD